MSTYDNIIAKGIEKGIELKTHKFVVKLTHSTDWNDARIALVVVVDEVSVRDICRQLQQAGQ